MHLNELKVVIRSVTVVKLAHLPLVGLINTDFGYLWVSSPENAGIIP